MGEKAERDWSNITEETRAKIVSKMDVTKFFAGFISLLIGILLGQGRMNSGWSRVGIIFFLLSLGFCVAAISAYDHLLWPKEYLIRVYWPELSKKQNWEELFQERLESQLICSWTFLFVPALMSFGIGFAFLLMEQLGAQLMPGTLGREGSFGLIILLMMIFGAPTAVWFAKWRSDERRAQRYLIRERRADNPLPPGL